MIEELSKQNQNKKKLSKTNRASRYSTWTSGSGKYAANAGGASSTALVHLIGTYPNSSHAHPCNKAIVTFL